MSKRRAEFIINITFYALIAALFYAVLKHLLPLVFPFLTAFIIAAVLQYPIRLLSARFPKIPKKITAALIIAVTLLTAGTAVFLLAGALIGEMTEFLSELPGFISAAAVQITGGASSGNTFISSLPPWIGSYIQRLYAVFSSDVPGFLLSLTDRLMDSVGTLGAAAMKLPSFAAVVLITIIMIFFIGVDYSSLTELLLSAIPPKLLSRLRRAKQYSADTVICLLKAYAFLMLLTFTELAVGFSLINLSGHDIPHAVPLALVTALVDILPVLGVGTVLIPWAIYDFIAHNPVRGIMLLVLYGIIVIIRSFLEPKLVGGRFGLHPAITLLAIYSGGKLFGFAGIFILPLTVIIFKRLSDTGIFKTPDENDRSVMDKRQYL